MPDVKPLTEAEIADWHDSAADEYEVFRGIDVAHGLEPRSDMHRRYAATIRALQAENAAQAEAIKAAREALHDTLAFLKRVGGQGHGGESDFDVAHESVRQALAKIDALPGGGGTAPISNPTHRHIKRGSTYTVERRGAEVIEAPIPDQSEIDQAEFVERFIARMVDQIGPTFDDGTSVADYARQTAISAWHTKWQAEDGPEACADAEIEYMGEG